MITINEIIADIQRLEKLKDKNNTGWTSIEIAKWTNLSERQVQKFIRVGIENGLLGCKRELRKNVLGEYVRKPVYFPIKKNTKKLKNG